MLSTSARAKATHPLAQTRQRELDGLQAEMETLRREALAEGALRQPDEGRLVELTQALQRTRDAYHRAANHVLGQRRGVSGPAANARIGALLGPRRADRPVVPGQVGVGDGDDDDKTSLFNQLQTLQEDASQFANEIENAKTKARDIEDKLAQTTRDLNEMKDAYDQREEEHKADLENARRQASSADDVDGAQAMQTLQEEKKNLENELANAEQRLATLEQSLEQAKAKIETCERDKDAVTTSLDSVKQQLSTANQTNTVLNAEKENLGTEKARLQEQIKASNQRNDELQTEINELEEAKRSRVIQIDGVDYVKPKISEISNLVTKQIQTLFIEIENQESKIQAVYDSYRFSKPTALMPVKEALEDIRTKMVENLQTPVTTKASSLLQQLQGLPEKEVQEDGEDRTTQENREAPQTEKLPANEIAERNQTEEEEKRTAEQKRLEKEQAERKEKEEKEEQAPAAEAPAAAEAERKRQEEEAAAAAAEAERKRQEDESAAEAERKRQEQEAAAAAAAAEAERKRQEEEAAAAAAEAEKERNAKEEAERLAKEKEEERKAKKPTDKSALSTDSVWNNVNRAAVLEGLLSAHADLLNAATLASTDEKYLKETFLKQIQTGEQASTNESLNEVKKETMRTIFIPSYRNAAEELVETLRDADTSPDEKLERIVDEVILLLATQVARTLDGSIHSKTFKADTTVNGLVNRVEYLLVKEESLIHPSDTRKIPVEGKKKKSDKKFTFDENDFYEQLNKAEWKTRFKRFIQHAKKMKLMPSDENNFVFSSATFGTDYAPADMDAANYLKMYSITRVVSFAADYLSSGKVTTLFPANNSLFPEILLRLFGAVDPDYKPNNIAEILRQKLTDTKKPALVEYKEDNAGDWTEFLKNAMQSFATRRKETITEYLQLQDKPDIQQLLSNGYVYDKEAIGASVDPFEYALNTPQTPVSPVVSSRFTVVSDDILDDWLDDDFA